MTRKHRTDGRGRVLPAWMQPEAPWKRCDGCDRIQQTAAPRCPCGGRMLATRPKAPGGA